MREASRLVSTGTTKSSFLPPLYIQLSELISASQLLDKPPRHPSTQDLSTQHSGAWFGCSCCWGQQLAVCTMLRLRGLGLLANLVDVATSSGRHAAVLEPAAAGLLLVQGRGSRHQQQRGYAEPAADVEPPSTSAAAALSLESRELTPSTVRSGVIAVKVGMTQEWDQWGVRVPLTVLWIDDCQVGRERGAGGAAEAVELQFCLA